MSENHQPASIDDPLPPDDAVLTVEGVGIGFSGRSSPTAGIGECCPLGHRRGHEPLIFRTHFVDLLTPAAATAVVLVVFFLGEMLEERKVIS